MAFDLGSLLQQYVGGATGAAPAQVEDHFDQVAQNASPGDLSNGLAAAFHSDSTPPFGQMVGELFGNASPNQQAGMLTSLVAGMAPTVLASLTGGNAGAGLGGILGRLLHGGAAPAAITPEQASQLTPEQVQELAQHAEQHSPGIVEQMSSFYAQHPTLVKTLGTAALGIAMSRMANRR